MLRSLAKQRLSKHGNAHPPIGLLIAGARRSIKQAATRRLRGRGLSATQFWLLTALHERPGPSLRELAERRLMDAPTASRMVDLLKRRGLVRIEADPRDRRRRSILLTARGAAVARDLHPLARHLREAIEEGFDAAEAEALRGMLRRVIANVERFERSGSSAAVRRAAARREG
jgi:DNA-binding MarR family transcriptional regulator